MGDMDSRRRLEGIVDAIDKSREEFLAYTPPWVDPAYETVRENVDRALRQVQLAVGVLFDEVAKAPTVPAGEPS